MSRRRFLGAVTSSLGLFVAAGLLLAHFTAGLAVHHVLSDSMTPAFSAGDRLVTLDTDPHRLRRGDVVLVMTPDMPAPVAHRVHDVAVTAGAVSVQTKGDANAGPDAWTDLLPGARVPVVATVLPGVLPGVPAGWGTGLKVLLVVLAGLGVTGLVLLPQWRARACDCPECTTSTTSTTTAAIPCASCGADGPARDLPVVAVPAPQAPSPLQPTPHQNEVLR
ncbi:signal peptidase I [Kineococcus sp. LSe6-4]|uniref:Signal peptidase I n=1 Tax=Kineococcus halophytocola TaxID=3234027 RepID=A0ABV4GX91_9ACTN